MKDRLKDWLTPSEEFAASERLATLLRWAVLVLVLMVNNFTSLYWGESVRQVNRVALVLGVLNLALSGLLWWRPRFPRLASLLLQLLDIAFISVLVALAPRIRNTPYDFLYALIILLSALRFGLVVSILFAVIVSLTYTQIVFSQPEAFATEDLRNAMLLARGVTFLGVGVVGGIMAHLERTQRRRRQEERRRSRELEVVQRVGGAISTTLELHELMERAFRSLQQVVPFTHGEITLWEGKEGCLVSHSSFAPEGYSARDLRYALGEGFSGWMAVHRQPLWIPDVSAETRVQPRGEVPMVSYIGVPLLVGDRLVGTLELSSQEKGAFDREDLEILIATAPQTAAMLDHARLYDRVRQRLERRVQQLSAIETIDRELSGTLDLPSMIQGILDRALEFAEADAGALLMMTEQKDGLLIVASQGYREELRARHSQEPWPLEVGVVGRVARTCEPALIEDASQDPDYRDATGETAAELAVPISLEGEVLGVLNLESSQPGRFDEEDLEFVQHLVEHVAIAMRNARLFSQEQRRARELATLHEIALDISGELALDRLLGATIRRSLDLLGRDAGSLWLYDEEADVLRCVATIADWRESTEMTLQPGQGLSGHVFASGEAVVVEDYRSWSGAVHRDPVGPAVGVPLAWKGQVRGVLNVLGRPGTPSFSEDEVNAISLLAAQAAIALENALLFQETRQWAEQMSLLQSVDRMLAGALGVRETMEALIKGVQELIPHSGGEVCLYDPERDLLVAEATLGEAARVASADVYTLDEGYSGWLARNRQPLLIEDCADFELRPKREEVVTSGQLRSYLGVPMLVGDRLIGTLEMVSDRPHTFGQEHLRLLTMVASQAAVSIDNARLYELTERRLRQRIEQLLALQRIGQELNTTLELEHNLQLIAEEAIRVSPATHGNIAMYDEAMGAFRVTSAQVGYSREEARLLRQLRFGRGHSMVDDVVRSGQPALVADSGTDPRSICVKKEARSALSVPILYEGRVVGVVNLRSTEVGAFQEEDLQFAQTLASQASLSVGNARRYEELVQQRELVSQRATQLREILEIGNTLRADRELADILGQIAYGVVGSVGFGLVLFNLASESDAEVMERVASAGIPLDDFRQMQQDRPSVQSYLDLFQEEYQISRSYFIPQEAGLAQSDAQTYLFPDMEVEKELPADEWHPHDMLLIPLYSSAGSLIGVMSVDNPFDRQRPARRTVEALEIFANQAAIAVENARLFRERERRITELNVLNRISRATTSTLDLNAMLVAIYERLAEAATVDVESFYIAIYDADREILRFYPVVDHGVLYDAYERPVQGMAGWIVEHREPLLLDDIEQAVETGFVERVHLAGWQGEQPQSYLGVPLMVGENLIGVISAQSYRRSAYGEREKEFLLTVANQVAVGIESARLFREREQRLAELAILNEIGQALSSALELSDLAEIVHQQVSRVFDTTNFFIALYEEETDEWEIIFEMEEGQRLPAERYKVEAGLSGHIIRNKSPLLFYQGAQIEAFQEERGIPAIGRPALSWLGVPLIAADKVVGVMAIQSYTQERLYDEQDLALFSTIAAQAAIAMDNARLFEERERRITELAILNEVGRAISSALELGELLEAVHQQVSRVFDATSFYIALYDEETDQWTAPFHLERGERQPAVWRKVTAGLTGHIIRGREAVLLHNVEENLAFHQAEGIPLVGEQAKSWLGVPLIAADKVVGVMGIQSYEQEYLYDEEDLALFSTIAAQAAIAIDNARLFQERERRITELAIVNEIGRVLASALETDEVTRTIYEQVGRVFDTTNFYVALYDEELREWETVLDIFQNETRSPERYSVDEGLTGHIIRNRQALLFYTEEELLHFHEEQGFAAVGEQAKSWLGVPMIAADRVVGVIGVESYTREYTFTQDDQAVLSTVAAQAAVALQNARLFEETRQRLQQVNTLLEVSRDVATQLDLSSLLQSILEAAVRSVAAADRGSILLLDQEAQELVVTAQIGYPEAAGRGEIRLSLDEGFAGWVCREGRADIVADTQSDPRFLLTESTRQVKSIMSAPLIGRGGLVGVINLDNLTTRGAFARQHLEFLSGLASQAAVAIENARLFEDRERRIAELGAVNEVGRAISSTMRLDELLETIRREAGRLVDTSNFLVAFYDERLNEVSFPVYHEYGERLQMQSRQAGNGLTEYVIHQRAPVLISRDTEEFCQERGIDHSGTAAKSWLGVPMIYMDRVIGIVALQDYEHAAAYDEHHVRLLSTIASQAAVAIQNARLFSDLETSRTELETRLIQLGALQEMGQAISGTLEMDAVIDTALAAVTETVGFSYAVISLVDEEAAEVRAVRGVGVSEEQIARSRRPLDATDIMADIVRTGKTEIIDGWDERLDREVYEQFGQADLVRVYAPLLARGKVIGLIEAGYPKAVRETITRDDIEVLQTFLAQASIAVDNARLFAEIRRFTEELERMVEARTQQLQDEKNRLEALHTITTELSSTLDLDEILLKTIDLASTATGRSLGMVLLRDPSGEGLICRAMLDEGYVLRPGRRVFPLAEVAALRRVMEERQALTIADVQQDPCIEELPDLMTGARSVVVVPLVSAEEVVGVILLTHSQVGFFDEEQVRLLMTLGGEVATAIHNAELYGYINEQALRLSEMLQYQQEEASKVRAILQSIADGVIVVDRADTIIVANPAAEQILGMTKEDLEGRNTAELPGLFSSGGLFAQDSHRFELLERFINVHSSPVVTNVGTVMGTVYVLRDITREVEADRAKSEFISTVSHELRTPLTSIKGYVDLILLGSVGDVSPMQKNFLDVVRSNANRLVELINDLLDISRIETGRIVINPEPLSVLELVEEVLASARMEVERKQLDVQMDVAPDLPLVRADRKRIVQVLTNLVSNAYKYTREGGQITVSACCTDGFLQISVADTGVGISEEDQRRLFTRFFRADNPLRDEVGGTGLGLAISRSFIELLGGKMWVESQLDVGSTFSFTLPLAARALQQEREAASARQEEGAQDRVRRGRPRILVVDDEPNIGDLLRYQLEQSGYEVYTARRGEEALRIAQEQHPDLITLDILMVGMDGFEVLERLKADEQTADIPVVIVSIVAERENLLAMGAVDFLPKPLQAEELLAAVGRVLATAGGGRRVLVADDDPDIVRWLRRVLEDEGFQVEEACNGEQALETVRTTHPELILLDLRMPKLDGREVIQQLKLDEETCDIAVIVITASSVDKERDRVQMLGWGAESFLTKPFTAGELVLEIERVFRERMEAAKE